VNIAFFGWVNACDPSRLGGTEALVRRLALGLSHRGHTVSVVMYGTKNNQIRDDFFGEPMTCRYFRSFSDALRELVSLKCTTVIKTYIHKRHCLQYLAFRRRQQERMRFLTILMSGPDRMLKERLGMMLKAKYCNTVLAVSPTLATALQECGTHAVWLPPPVPDEYFASPRDGRKARVVVSFLGRIDPNKGLHEVSSVFEALSRTDRFDLRIKGYYIPDNPESVQLHERLQRLAGVEYSAEAQDSCYDPRREQEVLRYLLQTDVLVLPYRNLTGTLGLPLIVLEGLAARCLVISRDVGDISRIVARNDLLMHRPHDLREKLERLSSVEAVEAERARLDTSSTFSTFAATRVVDRLIHCF